MLHKKITLLIVSILFYNLAFTQEEIQTVIIGNDTLPVSAIPLSNVSIATEDAYKEIKSIRDKMNTYQDQHVFDSLAFIGRTVINEGEKKILGSLDNMSEREILDAQNNWRKNKNTLSSWRDKFNSRMEEIDAMYKKTDLMRQNWTLTLEEARKQDAVDQLKISIENTLNDIVKINNEVKSKQNQFYLNQNTVTEFSLTVDNILEMLDEKSSALRMLYFKADAPPVWAASDTLGSLQAAKEQLRKYMYDSYENTGKFIIDNRSEFLFHFILFLVILVLGFLLKRFSETITDNISDITFAKNVVSTFVVLALFLSIFSSIWIYSIRPSIINSILGFLLIILSTFYFHFLFNRRFKNFLILGLVLLYIIDFILNIFGGKAFIFRIVLYFEVILSLFLLIYVLRKKEIKLQSLKLGYWAIFDHLIPVFILLILGVFIGNTFGFISLSIVLVKTVVGAIFDAIVLITLTLILNSIWIVLLETNYLQKSNIVKEYKASLVKWTTSIFNIVAIAIWIIAIIKNLRFNKEFWAWVEGLLDISWSIGTSTISLGRIFTVILVIIITIFVLKIISVILSKEIFPRVQLPRGVPGAISMMIRYTIVGFGFYFVLSAAGIDLGKFGLIAGALGVGIGFGLQNIVFNFIAGLVLAFERPIQVGDVIEVGTLMGTVTSIGVRSSNVKTFDGSEVIVPNGNLISKEVINWTLSDRKKRREISVGVAYGSDPHKVLEILLKTASEHVNVLETPAPWATFEGFGDSSLNFKIRFWVPFDVGLSTKSQIAMSIYDALKEAGINIPFPQQDVYIKSAVSDYRDVTEQKFNTPGFKSKPDKSDKTDQP